MKGFFFLFALALVFLQLACSNSSQVTPSGNMLEDHGVLSNPEVVKQQTSCTTTYAFTANFASITPETDTIDQNLEENLTKTQLLLKDTDCPGAVSEFLEVSNAVFIQKFQGNYPEAAAQLSLSGLKITGQSFFEDPRNLSISLSTEPSTSLVYPDCIYQINMAGTVGPESQSFADTTSQDYESLDSKPLVTNINNPTQSENTTSESDAPGASAGSSLDFAQNYVLNAQFSFSVFYGQHWEACSLILF